MNNLSNTEQNNQNMTFGDWFLTLFLSSIPLVGFILLLVWAFSGSTNISKKNWAKANLLWNLIGFLLFVIFLFFFLFSWLEGRR